MGPVAQSVYRLAKDWTFRGSNPGGARFSGVHTGPGAHPASCTMGTGSFSGFERGRGVTLTSHPLLVPRSKNRLGLYLYSPLGPSWSVKWVKPTYSERNAHVILRCRWLSAAVLYMHSGLSPRKASAVFGLITYRSGCFTFVGLGHPHR